MTRDRGMWRPAPKLSRRWWLRAQASCFGLSLLGACLAGEPLARTTPINVAADRPATPSNTKELRMWMTIDKRRFAVTLADNATARAFAARLPLTLDMSELNGNEKHADLMAVLPTGASRPGTIRSGDLMLYGERTVVIFYATFDSSYAYTPLGRVDDPAGLAEALGRGSVAVTFALR